MDAGLKKAVEAMGSMVALASALGRHRQAVYRWPRVPAERVIEIEHLTGVPREELRPDLYLAPRPKRAVPRATSRT